MKGPSSAIPESDKFHLLDSLRGIASFWVVLFHMGGAENFVAPFSWIVKRGEVGVQIFFVLSGYVIFQSIERHISKGNKGVVIFLGKRVRRIYPAFWASLVFVLIVNYLILNQQIFILQIPALATLVYPYFNIEAPQVIYWTLVFEQQFYLVMAVLMLPLVRDIRIPLLLGSTLITLAIQFGVVSNRYVNSTLASHWFEFLLGILVYIVLHYKKWRIPSAIILGGLTILGLQGGYRMQAAVLTAMLLLALRPWDLEISKSKLQTPFAWLGKISYSLYLVHLPVILLTSTALERLGGLDFYSAYVIQLALVLIVAAIFYHLFERSFLSTRSTAAKATSPGGEPIEVVDSGPK